MEYINACTCMFSILNVDTNRMMVLNEECGYGNTFT